MTKGHKQKHLISFVSQKGGVGKSTLARLLAVGAAHRGHKTLLADFDLEQLTCVEWNATRMRNSIEPEIDARPFKSLKKLHKSEEEIDVLIADTRGLADETSKELAEDSDVVFLPTGTSSDDLRPTLALARKLAKHGAEGRIVIVLSIRHASSIWHLKDSVDTFRTKDVATYGDYCIGGDIETEGTFAPVAGGSRRYVVDEFVERALRYCRISL